jgi:GTPase
MFDIKDRPRVVERAFLLSAYFDRRESAESEDLVDELKELVQTLGITVVEVVNIYVREPTARYLTGSGKCEELCLRAKALECDCIVIDNEISPAQQRAWEEASGLSVIDRHEVILDIFNMRAQTKEARLQVELARLEYSLPRLTRMWAHLDRQGGSGSGGSASGAAARGEGETQLETDRRLAHKRVDRVKAELEEVKRNRDTMRKERSRVPVPHAAIVGYTNVGKSSLLNHLTGATVLAENKLFATMDTTTRRMELPDGQDILLTDTVGFVRRLPHDLVQSFRATLEEAIHADLLIHVLDAAHPRVHEFYTTTTQVMKELGAGDKKVLLVLNKMDLVTEDARHQELKLAYPDAVPISILENTGMEELLHRLHLMLADRIVRLRVLLPMHRMDLVNLAHQEGKVLSEKYTEHGAHIQVAISKRWESRYSEYLSTAEE